MGSSFSLNFSAAQLEKFKLSGQSAEFNLKGVSLPQQVESNSLVFLKEQKFLDKLRLDDQAHSVVFIIAQELKEKVPAQLLKGHYLYWSSQIDLSLVLLSEEIYKLREKDYQSHVDGRITGSAQIDPAAKISQQVFIGDQCVIEEGVEILPGSVVMHGAVIKKNSILFPQVTIYPHCIIGESCRIHSGTVIGSDGFGYHFHNGEHLKIWQSGGVIIGDQVEIGANSCVDCGTFVPTVIGSGSKIDNQVQVAHNTQLGRAVILCGQAGTAGSSSAGDYTVFGGRAGLGPDCHLGAGCQLAGGAMVNRSWPAGSQLGGHPAQPIRDWIVATNRLRKLARQKESRK